MRSKMIMLATAALWIAASIAFLIIGPPAAFVAALFGGAALLAVVMLCVMIARAKREVDAEEDNRKSEAEDIERINSTYRCENDSEQAIYMLKHSMKAWRHASMGDKLKGILFVATFLVCCALFVVFISIGHPIWGIISWCAGVALILTSFVVVKIKEKLSLSAYKPERKKNGKPRKIKPDPTEKIVPAVVKYCVLSSSGGFGTSNAERISWTIYKIELEIEGKIKTCYSREYFESGEEVSVFSRKNGKRLMIIGRKESKEEQ